MGYTTKFRGQFNLNPSLSEAQAVYLRKFSRTRRMARNPEITITMPDPEREAVGLPVGNEGAYYVGSKEFAGQERIADVLDYNTPPEGQPGLWCQWVPTDDRTGIEWDQGEKFYEYAEWMNYIIDNFLSSWGIVASGEVRYRGEGFDDNGAVVIDSAGRAVRVAGA